MRPLSEAQVKLTGDTEKLKEKNEELRKSMADSAAAFDGNKQKMDVQAGAAEKLADRVFDLAEKENKSAEEKAQLARMVEELNKTMPGLNLLYDEESGLLNMNRDAVMKLIEAKKEEMMQQAMAERAVELLKEQLDLEHQREQVLKQIADWENAGNVKEKDRQKAIEELRGEYENLGVQIEETEGAVDALMDSMMESSAKQAEAVNASTEGMSADFAEYQQSVEDAAKAQEDAAKREEAALKEREQKLADYKKAATDMFNSIERESKVSVEDMIGNLKNNQAAVAEWSEGLETLAKRGVDQGILEELRKGGPQAAGILCCCFVTWLQVVKQWHKK